VLGFEYVPGRHPDYSPGSPDLEVLASTIATLQKVPSPGIVQRPVTRRWVELGEDVSPMEGDALLHTDLNAHNLIIREDGAPFVVDWAFVARGAPWVELGQLVPWLLLAGHTPHSAEDWLSRFPAWRGAAPSAVSWYARLHSTVWTQRASTIGEPWMPPYAAEVRRWATYRGVT
jgi:aminoglycoside phosphotransferase (APT) family kinase protein